MIGQRIAALRREAAMSQAELAALLQVSPSAVGMYEQGRREPSADTLVSLARIFKVSTDYLLTGQPSGADDRDAMARILSHSVAQADLHLEQRPDRPFSRQELLVLFTAMLMEP